MSTTATLSKPDPFADLMKEWRKWSKALPLPADKTADEIEEMIAAGQVPVGKANRAWAADFVKRWRQREEEVYGPLKFFAVTVEYHSTEHKTVAVAARSLREAIDKAYQQDDGGWSTYDQLGDSYIGHVAEYPTLDDAENAWGHNAEGALNVPAIPFEDREDCEKLAEITKVARTLLTQLKHARECITYCRKNHKDAQSGEGFPVEMFIDAAITEASALLPDFSKGGA